MKEATARTAKMTCGIERIPTIRSGIHQACLPAWKQKTGAGSSKPLVRPTDPPNILQRPMTIDRSWIMCPSTSDVTRRRTTSMGHQTPARWVLRLSLHPRFGT